MCVPAVEYKNTMLEHAVLRELRCNSLSYIRQEEIDEITPAIMEWLAPEDIHDHMVAVYDNTAARYAQNPQHYFVIPGLVELISMLKDGDEVLELGCGHGRDTLYMVSPDRAYRASRMRGSIDASTIPTMALRVKAIDSSARLIAIAEKNAKDVDASGAVRLRYPPRFARMDMHEDLKRFDDSWFAGVWSCASFLTHTPRQWVEPTLAQIARILAPGGVFAVSYTQRQPGHGYDYLKLSSTGEIKYFSQPIASEVVDLAKNFDLQPIKCTLQNDYVDSKSGAVITGLFVTQFFRKE